MDSYLALDTWRIRRLRPLLRLCRSLHWGLSNFLHSYFRSCWGSVRIPRASLLEFLKKAWYFSTLPSFGTALSPLYGAAPRSVPDLQSRQTLSCSVPPRILATLRPIAQIAPPTSSQRLPSPPAPEMKASAVSFSALVSNCLAFSAFFSRLYRTASLPDWISSSLTPGFLLHCKSKSIPAQRRRRKGFVTTELT